MNLRKKLAYLFLCLALLVTSCNIGTYAFLSDKATNSNNSISTGKFPKPIVKLYASVGPIYKNFFTSNKDYESPNYRQWLDNASTFIINDLLNKTSQEPVGSDYNKFQNILSNNSDLINVKNDISTSSFKSWAGEIIKNDSSVNEHGSLMHNIVVIGTPIKEGLNLGKINVNSCGLQIEQQDIFQSIEKKNKDDKMNEYVLKRDANELNLASSTNRIITFDYVNGKYVKTGTGTNQNYVPATEADLIIFDIGSEGYSVLPDEKSNPSSLNYLNNLLIGKRVYAKRTGKDLTTPWTGKMKDLVLNKMVPNEDYRCRLDRTECTAIFTYKDYQVSPLKYVVNYLNPKDSTKEITSKDTETNVDEDLNMPSEIFK
ncbi:hypothetical protein [Clostridium sp. YIM B02551]|uniref:hypothetical protein n=1 Tax=Clostridium sp. YIM B02551 TaxID=2910679 RepID=UPI001EEC75CD|nr:hypothetical protein [Clostridium sp. YIM B02551]